MKKYFTMTEILVVIFLIGALSAMGFGLYTYAMNRGKENATKAIMAQIVTGLDTTHNKLGYYPVSNSTPAWSAIAFTLNTTTREITAINFGSGNVSSDFLKEFLKTVDGDTLTRYLDPVGSSNTNYNLVDSWGNQIYYAFPPLTNFSADDRFLLLSAGPDGKFGKGASSTPSTNINDYKDSSTKEPVSDDLLNF